MAATRLLMRRLRELLRLKSEAGLSHRAIAQACHGPCLTIWMTSRWKRACLRDPPFHPSATGSSRSGRSSTRS